MERIVNYIKELLFEHDCVIIPGFGGIITNYEPAYIHPVKNIFRPPSKELAFNGSLQQNDGLLVSVCSLKEGCTSTEALEKIHEFVCHIYDEIEEYSSYSIEGIGKFTLNVEHNLQFEPEKGLNYLVQSYELPEFYFKPIVRDELDMKRVPPRPRPVVRRAPVKRAPQAAKTEGSVKVNKDAAAKAIEAKKEASSKQPKSAKPAKVKKEKVVKEKVQSDRSANKQPVYIILPVIILIGVIIGGVIGMMNGGAGSGHDTHEASIVPGASDHSVAAATTDENKEDDADKGKEDHDGGENHDESSDSDADETLAGHVEDKEETLIEEEGVVAEDSHQDEESDNTTTTKEEEPVVKEEVTHEEEVDNSSSSDIISSPSGRFYIIAGSFGDKSNADKLINKIGSSAKVVRKRNAGLYNVAIKSYGSWQAAKSDLSTYTGDYGSGIWIMKY